MTRIGELRNPIEIQRMSDSTADEYGQTTETPITVSTVWAEIIPLQGRELLWGKSLHEQVTHRITIRYFEGLTSKHQFKSGNQIYKILVPPIDENLRHEWHISMCVEEV